MRHCFAENKTIIIPKCYAKDFFILIESYFSVYRNERLETTERL